MNSLFEHFLLVGLDLLDDGNYIYIYIYIYICKLKKINRISHIKKLNQMK